MLNNVFKINYEEKGKDFPHYWEHCVGSCHAYTALRADYQEQLKKSHEELGFQYVRFHGLFDDDMSVCKERFNTYTKESEGISYCFTNVDKIFDFLLDIGMKPFIELGFMPSCLASGDDTCFHYKGNVTPPKSYEDWANLIYKFTKHLVDRYGIEEVSQWFFEVWNEPNLSYFWKGTKEEYFKLYEYSAKAIKSVNPELKVGGPATSINAWIVDIIDFCKKKDVPLDFISTHHYPTDDPLWKNSDMNMEELFPILANKWGKYERGIIRKMTTKAREEAGELPLYYTEWNTSAFLGENLHDECYPAAMIAKILADNDGLVDGYSYWTFTDIFEEKAQMTGPFHGGFGLQTVEGIEKPKYRTFELFHNLSNERIDVEGILPDGTLEMIATKTKNGIKAVLYNHQVVGESILEESCKVVINNIPVNTECKVELIRIDENHSNPKAKWIEMGSPEYLKKSEILELREVSKLKQEIIPVDIKNNQLEVEITLPPHGICALNLEFIR